MHRDTHFIPTLSWGLGVIISGNVSFRLQAGKQSPCQVVQKERVRTPKGGVQARTRDTREILPQLRSQGHWAGIGTTKETHLPSSRPPKAEIAG